MNLDVTNACKLLLNVISILLMPILWFSFITTVFNTTVFNRGCGVTTTVFKPMRGYSALAGTRTIPGGYPGYPDPLRGGFLTVVVACSL